MRFLKLSKPRKKYRPKTISNNTINYVIGGFRRIGGERLTELQTKNSAAMFKICQGIGTKQDFDVLVGMSNMAKVLCETEFDLKYVEILRAGQNALEAVGRRFLKLGKFVLKGDEITALNDMIEVHDAQISCLRVIDLERAFDEVNRRLNHGINVTKITEKA